MPDLTEHPVSSKTVYKGRLLHVKEDQVRLPNGHIATREYIDHPGAVIIIAVLDNGDILMERQFRYPLGKIFYELPAGKIDEAEDTLTCAQRELLEETGYTAKDWQYVTSLHPAIGYSSETMVLYLARGLSYAGQQLDKDEFLEVLPMPLNQALEKVRCGEITEVKAMIGLFWAEKISSSAWTLGKP
ncbi:MAG: NUDIX domain-containing protein [Burkholderiales bacterium]